MKNMEQIKRLLSLHAQLLEENPYCYFELAHTRQTGWMAWICTDAVLLNPNRKVLAKGQGATPSEACKNAFDDYAE